MPGSIQSIERAAAVLRLLAAPPGRLTLAQIVASLHLAKGTAHGILRTLVDVGFVEQDDATGRYLLSDALLDLGSTYLDPNEIRARSMNWADPLASRTGCAVQVGVLAGAVGEVEVVHHVFRPSDATTQHSTTGERLPAHATALGKALLAFSPSRASAPLAPFTGRTIVAPTALADELRRIRTAGHAVDVEEHVPGRAGVAAPVEGSGGLVVAAVGVLGPPETLCSGDRARREILGHVQSCARHIAGEIAATRAEALRTRRARMVHG